MTFVLGAFLPPGLHVAIVGTTISIFQEGPAPGSIAELAISMRQNGVSIPGTWPIRLIVLGPDGTTSQEDAFVGLKSTYVKGFVANSAAVSPSGPVVSVNRGGDVTFLSQSPGQYRVTGTATYSVMGAGTVDYPSQPPGTRTLGFVLNVNAIPKPRLSKTIVARNAASVQFPGTWGSVVVVSGDPLTSGTISPLGVFSFSPTANVAYTEALGIAPDGTRYILYVYIIDITVGSTGTTATVEVLHDPSLTVFADSSGLPTSFQVSAPTPTASGTTFTVTLGQTTDTKYSGPLAIYAGGTAFSQDITFAVTLEEVEVVYNEPVSYQLTKMSFANSVSLNGVTALGTNVTGTPVNLGITAFWEGLSCFLLTVVNSPPEIQIVVRSTSPIPVFPSIDNPINFTGLDIFAELKTDGTVTVSGDIALAGTIPKMHVKEYSSTLVFLPYVAPDFKHWIVRVAPGSTAYVPFDVMPTGIPAGATVSLAGDHLQISYFNETYVMTSGKHTFRVQPLPTSTRFVVMSNNVGTFSTGLAGISSVWRQVGASGTPGQLNDETGSVGEDYYDSTTGKITINAPSASTVQFSIRVSNLVYAYGVEFRSTRYKANYYATDGTYNINATDVVGSGQIIPDVTCHAIPGTQPVITASVSNMAPVSAAILGQQIIGYMGPTGFVPGSSVFLPGFSMSLLNLIPALSVSSVTFSVVLLSTSDVYSLVRFLITP